MAKIQVMISSRCNDEIKKNLNDKATVKLSSVRQKLKTQIEDFEILGEKPFQVWIHENPPKGESGEWIWDDCIQQSKKADIFIALYNGNSGYTNHEGGMGLCHAELKAAISSGASKVKIIQLPLVKKSRPEDLLFMKYFKDIMKFRFREVGCETEIEVAVKDAIADALIELTKLGIRESKKSKYDIGEALTWSKLNYADRKSIIEEKIRDSLKLSFNAIIKDNGDVSCMFGRSFVDIVVTGMPATFSVSKAKELTGKPFQKDHSKKENKESGIGPIHMIGCYKNISESQVMSIVGDPDVAIIKSGFGIYVYDPIFHIQIVFIANCRDEETTKHGIQRFLDWLKQSEELESVIDRAKCRKKIIETLHKLKGKI